MHNAASPNIGPEEFGRVAVVMGGQSAEREISLKTGKAVLDALLSEGVDAVAMEPGPVFIEQLKHRNIDRVFIALHGPGGEDGTIQGALELAGIPYTGSGVMASAIAMDKAKSKLIWQALNIATPSFQLLHEDEEADENWQLGVEYPLAVKPVAEGSSIGIYKVKNDLELKNGLAGARRFGEAVLIEQWVEGDEFTVAILKDRTLPAIGMSTTHEFFDFDAKYKDGDTEYRCPCGLTEQQENEMAELSLAAFRTLDCSGWGRVDLMRDTQGKFWVIEVNTVPGLTDHSLVPMAAAVAGIEYSKLVLEILESSFN